MSDSTSRPIKAWAMVDAKGSIKPWGIRATRTDVLDYFTDHSTPKNPREAIWRRYRRMGYRIVKVEVRGVE